VEGTASVDVTIIGTGFVAGSIARIGIENLPTTVISDTELVATVAFPEYNAGAYFISVLNPDAQSSAAKPFMVTALAVPAPVLTSISPTTAVVGDPPITMTVIGTGFEGASVVQFWGAAVPTVFVSATELTGTVTLDGYGASEYPVSVANGEVLSNTILFPLTDPVTVARKKKGR